MTANNDPIGKKLNLTPLNQIAKKVDTLIASSLNDSARSDFETARVNLHSAINTGIDAMNTLSMIAESSQHPRAFEVLAKLIDSIATASKDLMELQQQIRTLDASDKPINSSGPNNVTNVLFAGSTAQLQEIIKQMRQNE